MEKVWKSDGDNLFSIEKELIGKYRFYRVINDKGEIVKEFDDYNYKKPFKQAKNFIASLLNK